MIKVLPAAASMLALTTISAHAQGASQPSRSAQDEAKIACLFAAGMDYNKANLALMASERTK
jgi:hypothetical protein